MNERNVAASVRARLLNHGQHQQRERPGTELSGNYLCALYSISTQAAYAKT